ncbi:helix-turn-helix domain-containing protein [Kitasatospora sp. NBC_00374]|uniref:helix-turn-helix domain-containing protein n=1 Tax=Kitasatospora sp. NBC_00374 TaxID=2975964 RepID=UPI00352C1087
MPRPPRPLEPSRSAAHWLGAEIRHWRSLRGLTQNQLGALVHISGDLVSKMEKAERPCRPTHAAALDAALDTGGVLSRCLALANAEMDNRSRLRSAQFGAARVRIWAMTCDNAHGRAAGAFL